MQLVRRVGDERPVRERGRVQLGDERVEAPR